MKAQLAAGVVVCLSVIAGCAGKKENASSRGEGQLGASSSDGALGGNAQQAQVEKPLFVGSAEDLQLSCQLSGKLNFLASQGLSSSNSYLLARFAMIGDPSLPFDKETLPKWLARFGLEKMVALENVGKGVKGFVATSSQFNLVVFQGTHSLQGAVTDLQAVVASASPNNIPGGMHNGFKTAYDTVSAQLSEALKAGREQKTPTYFVGHSLGGALAVIASSEQHKAGVNVAGVVTLGQPRVGNAEFTAAFEKALQNKYNRYVYENDPVPHLPPSQSTGNQVSSMVSGVNGIGGLLSSGMGLLFSRAAFTHAAAPQTLGNARFSSSGFTNDDEWDKSYWGSNASAVGQIVANPQSALKDSVVADHDVNKYLCSMLEKVDSN